MQTAFENWKNFGNQIQSENITFDQILEWTRMLKDWQRELKLALTFIKIDQDRIHAIFNKIQVLQKLTNIQKIINLFERIISHMNLNGNFETLTNLLELVSHGY